MWGADSATREELVRLEDFIDQLSLGNGSPLRDVDRVSFLNILKDKRLLLSLPLYNALLTKIRTRFDKHRAMGEHLVSSDSKFQFFLLRDAKEWRDKGNLIHGGQCGICFYDVDEGHPAFACKHHDTPLLYHATAAANEHEHCRGLLELIKSQTGLITCMHSKHPHELALTDELLKCVGFSEQACVEMRIGILLAYYQELFGDDAVAVKWCPNRFCYQPIFADETDAENNFACPSCLKSFCFQCTNEIHPGKTCDEAVQIWRDPASMIRPCPWCYILIEKTEACNHMTCIRCKKAFHYVHGRYRENSPDNLVHDFPGPEGVPPRLYRVPGEDGYIPNESESSWSEADYGPYTEDRE